MSGDDLLFLERDLASALDATRRDAVKAIETWDPDQLLATAEADIVDYLIAEHSVACPVLRRDEIHQLPVADQVAVVEDWGGREITQIRTKIVIVVPFDGEDSVFRFRASQYKMTLPEGIVRPGELQLTWIGDGVAGNPTVVRQHFDERLDQIEERLSWSRHDIDKHNAELGPTIRTALAHRKAKLLADRHLEAGLGYPVRQRSDAAKYAAPVTRRTITAATPRPEANGPFRPEPVLPEAQYAQALAVLRNTRNALERTPSMTANLNEEKIRDLLLVMLNAQFERQSGRRGLQRSRQDRHPHPRR